MNGRRVALLAFVLFLVAAVGSVGVVGSQGTSATDQSGSPQVGVGTLHLVQELALTPERPGEITVTVRYEIPEGVVELRAQVPGDAIVTATEGFTRRSLTEYAWTRATREPSVTYRLAVNETIDRRGPLAGKGEYVFVDPGPWALVEVPPPSTTWTRRRGTPVEINQTVRTAGPGAAGDAIAYLGASREVRRTAHDQTFRLIVPRSADLAESPDELLDAMTAASDALRVGDRDESVFAVAAPTRSISWGVRGLQTGDADFWVRDAEDLDTADNTWLHEYVHTRQDFATTEATRWLTEATATYYGALLALEGTRVGFEAFAGRLSIGSGPRAADAVLAAPWTWEGGVPYFKGALVAGDLDRYVRLATDRRASLQTVFSRLNAYDGVLTREAIYGFVAHTANESVAARFEVFATTTAAPEMWTRREHERAFRPDPARIGYALPETDDAIGYRVRGPFRSARLAPDEPIRLAAGETLAFQVRVTNAGGTPGTYAAELRINGEAVASRTGRLDPGASTVLGFEHAFAEPGEYTVSVGASSVAVSVREPPRPNVTVLDVRRRGDGRVEITATLRNEDVIPAVGNVTLYQDGRAVATRRVTLETDGERRVVFERDLGSGDYVFRVGDLTARVSIAETASPTTEPATNESLTDRSDGTTGRTPGFGPVVALAGIACFLLVRRWW